MARISADKTRQMILKPSPDPVTGVVLENLELFNPDGTPASIGAGADGEGFSWANDWVTGTDYPKNAVARSTDGNLYISKAAIADSATAPEDDAANWDLFVEVPAPSGGGGGGVTAARGKSTGVVNFPYLGDFIYHTTGIEATVTAPEGGMAVAVACKAEVRHTDSGADIFAGMLLDDVHVNFDGGGNDGDPIRYSDWNNNWVPIGLLDNFRTLGASKVTNWKNFELAEGDHTFAFAIKGSAACDIQNAFLTVVPFG